MILIADSGSTKTDWAVVEEGKIIGRVNTAGMNPFFQTAEEMKQLLQNHLAPYISDYAIETVYFYGAGCTPEKHTQVRDALTAVLAVKTVVESDLLGAARALCGHSQGIACIMGTGSNSCFYDGKEIQSNIPPLGYVLGDEGGGAHLGRTLVKEYLRGGLSAGCRAAFAEQFGLTKEEVLQKVYKEPFPNRFLAGFTPFLSSYLNKDTEEKELRIAIKNCFVEFFRQSIKRYDYKMNKVGFVGSIAWCFRSLIEEVAEEEGVCVWKIYRNPIEGLVEYHSL